MIAHQEYTAKNPRYSVSVNGVLSMEGERVEILEQARFVLEASEGKVAGLEIPITRNYLDKIHANIRDELFSMLRPYSGNTLHVIVDDIAEAEKSYFDGFCELLADLDKADVSIAGIVAHPDDIFDMQKWLSLVRDDFFVALEVLGIDAEIGNSVAYFEELLTSYPNFSLTLDTAHAMQTKEIGGSSSSDYVERWSEKIRHFHLSQTGNLYHNRFFGDDFYTHHSLFCLSEENFAEEIAAIKSAPNAVRTIEGVIPMNAAGAELLRQELEFLSKNTD